MNWGQNRFNEDFSNDTHKKIFKDIAKIASKYYDLVFIDIDSSLDEDITNSLLEISDLVVANISQKIRQINDYIKVKEEKTSEETKKTQMELDAEYVKEKCKFIVPAKGTVTSRYGEREATEIVSAYHYGIDIGNDIGTAIYASMAGTVTLVSSEGDYRKACWNYGPEM